MSLLRFSYFLGALVYADGLNSICFPTGLTLGVLIIFLSSSINQAFNSKLFSLTSASDCLHLTSAMWARSDLIFSSDSSGPAQGHIHTSSKNYAGKIRMGSDQS